MAEPQIFAFSGMLVAAGDRLSNLDLTTYPLGLCAGRRVCYVPPAVGGARVAIDGMRAALAGRRPHVEFSVLTLFPQPNVPDVRAHLLGQDVVFVEGGSVVNLLAVWRSHGLPDVLRECWQAGVVLAGASAGSLCWHLGGPTDSFRDALDPYADGLGFLPHSNGVHDDFEEQPRRATYRRMVADGTLPPGYATEDGVGLHYVGTTLREAVTARPGSRAWHVTATGADPIEARLL